MSKQMKLSDFKCEGEEKKKIAHILDLEKKYFDILWNIFTSKGFINDLQVIEKEIQKEYDFLHKTWELKNKLKIPAERLTRQYIYRDLSEIIKHIYPLAISSDCAFITNDAVINLDVKTLDTIGNQGDIKNLQFENNQSSFDNVNLDADAKIPNSGIKVECLLPQEYSYNGEKPLPVLTYFLTIIYSDDGKSFNLNRDDNYQTIYLKCLPNGFLSPLFDNDIVDNFKDYLYFKQNSKFPPEYLTDDKNKIVEKLKEFIRKKPEFILIQGRSKIGAFNSKQIHPKYKTSGISWFPVSRIDKVNKKLFHYYLEAVYKGHTNRLSNSKIETRYDSDDNIWIGVKKYKL